MRTHLFLLAVSLVSCSSDTGSPMLVAGSQSIERLIERSWAGDTSDIVDTLLFRPATCVLLPDDPDMRQKIAFGELIFNSQYLLGGQTAKAGVSCAACHRNGRDNPVFHLQAISGPPGTADVSHGLFGPLREDDHFNPVPIPDLATPAGKTIINRQDSEALSTFLSDQIVEEFSGDTPSPIVLDSLIAYLRALDVSACSDARHSEPVSWRTEIERVRVSVQGIEAARQVEDAGADAFAYAGRAALERLYHRYSRPEHASLRDELLDLSALVANAELPTDIPATLDALSDRLEQHAPTSLYDSQTLRQAIATR